MDVRSSKSGRFVEGVVVDKEKSKVLILYTEDEAQHKEWIDQESARLAKVGKFTGVFDEKEFTTEEINSYLVKERREFKPTEPIELKFRKKMAAKGLEIQEIKGDGNCLYRAFAHQIYGDQSVYLKVKEKCLAYLEQEEEFFGQFTEFGPNDFDKYIIMKSRDGVWGDDLEIQAMSEIYNRKVEIYALSEVPMKTFREASMDRLEREQTSEPIRLSYHGMNHYNALVPIDQEEFKKSLTTVEPGVFEDMELAKLEKLKKEQQKKQDFETNRLNFEKSKKLKRRKELGRNNARKIDVSRNR